MGGLRSIQTWFAAILVAVIVALGAAGSVVLAIEPDEILKDAALEARARAISAELRCPVCQNQSIDDSNAPLARDLRILVRERLVAGDSDAGVKHFLVARYGDFVLLKPPISLSTVLLWATPAMVLGLVVVVIAHRSMRSAVTTDGAAVPLTADEKAQLADILREDASGHSGAARPEAEPTPGRT
jgi:cytochrome c-type biogenesis protein CcmH